MQKRRLQKMLTTGAAFVAVLVLGISLVPSKGKADNDNNAAQDEKQMIQIGLNFAANRGIHLNMSGKDSDMVGLGSYIVNVAADCNGCHTPDPSVVYTNPGNPYLLGPPNGPFTGATKNNPAGYLGGGSDFGVFPSPNGSVHIISRNLTPGKTGLPEGDHTLAEFTQILRTGIDLDKAHLNCTNSTNPPITNNCLLGIPPYTAPPPGVPPFDGTKLQVMPWPAFQNLTDRQIAAIYTFLAAIPCLEGGPGEAPNRCK